MSLSRPDPASPAQVADASFSTGRRGFDQHEVRDFLRTVSGELGRLLERERFLEGELEHAQAAPALDAARLDDETLTTMLGEETARVLHAARESAHEIREKAEQAAARMLMEASDEATRRREEAEIESARRRADANNDAEAELSMAKQQGREMVNEARAYRERVLSELARRRELAREQIEQLVHGRDQLMQAFERARVVAVEVVAEMQPLGEPEEYVDLTPSTGPVPVMVARTDLGVASTADAADEALDDTVDETVDADADAAIMSDDGADDAALADVVDDVDDVDANESAENSDDDAESHAAPRPDPDDGSVDDVVVDLFARLRAGGASADVARDTEVDDEIDEADDVDQPIDDVEDDDTVVEANDVDDAVVDDADDADDDEALREATLFDQRSADLTPLIVASARKLKRVLADEQNEVLDALRRRNPVQSLEDLLPTRAVHSSRYSTSVADDLLLAAHAGASLLDDDRVTTLRKPAAKAAVEHASETIGRWLVDPLRDRLERCVVDGDGDNTAITKKVRAVYREFKTQHIDEQLDDVVRTAHGQGLLASLPSATPVEWTPNPAVRACPDCDDNRLAGAVPSRDAFPTGHTSPPAHPGCRCMLQPVRR